MKLLEALFLLSSAALLCPAQEFDVASIRPGAAARVGGEGSAWDKISVTPTGVTILNAGLGEAIQWAYRVDYHQVSGPDWINRERWDITAKTGQPHSNTELRQMMQALLAERFRLRIRRERRPLPVYVLAARKNAPKPPESTGGSRGIRVVDGSFVFQHVTMADFAELLGQLAGIESLVLDRTGIAGTYDITLRGAAQAMREDPGSIFRAVEPAGLELQARKEPLEVIVVEHAERPAAN